jgi:thiamine-phosphate pyrophosphorylase
MEIMEKRREIYPGVYVVIDPGMEEDIIIRKLGTIIQEKIIAVQLWDNFSGHINSLELIGKITRLCHTENIPVLVNNRWEWLLETELDGVHFDGIPEDIEKIRKTVKRDFIGGLTCNNDLSVVHWADENFMDYISFCSIFPSSTSNSCELVEFETIREARKITRIPVFLAGGIKPGNMNELNSLSFDGVAVISGIMNSDAPGMSVRSYIENLDKTIKPSKI